MRVVLAKAVVVAGIGAATSVLAVLVSFLGLLVHFGPVVDPVRGAAAGSGTVLHIMLCGLLGLALAGLTRSALAAYASLLAWLIGEQLVLDHVDPNILPFFSGFWLADVSPEYDWTPALPMVALTAAALVGAVVAVSRRDV
ncbi:hypothetical protein OU415_05175 [Saccharopolyspora sp. WRP15-2]|uniref:ABC transporter permease n=1 Tax=Saccharopolyspora oryzae TaxID=2997343 RepID=A0ABT4USY6_9PSEU|nr:hypothetical protein [Saccharopolyspora oryzae]MDA3624820.1 hypothetical protein [Saccharopolyspora oryzae]